MAITETIPESLDGERVDRVVATITGLTRAAIAEAVKKGAVRIDGRPVKTRSQPVTVGQTLAFDEPTPEDLTPKPQKGIEFKVVYEDEHIVVVDKPVGLVVHPGAGHPDKTLVNGLLDRFPDINKNRPGQPLRPGIVHRLDAGTTGLLICSRTEEAHQKLVTTLKAREIERRYIALVWNDVQPDSGMIDGPIGRGERRRTQMTVSVRGKDARTSYEVLQRKDVPTVTLVKAKLETGRTHQIRVHFAAIGNALVGDRRYDGLRESIPMERPFLHAESLAFDHPVTGKRMEFRSPLPSDLREVLQKLELKIP